MAKKIQINGRFLCRKPTGVDRFAAELMRVIDAWVGQKDRRVSGLNFEILVPSLPILHWSPLHIPIVTISPFQGHAWEQISLARAFDGDLLLSLCNTGPAAVRNQVVAIHDATPVRMGDAFSRSFRLLYRLLMPVLGKVCRSVLTVSQFSKGEIAECYGIDGNKICVVPNGADHVAAIECDGAILSSLGLLSDNYALAVATQAKHKNLEALLRVAALMPADFCLVLVGGLNAKVFGDSVAIDKCDKVVTAGFVSDGELRALYEGARCFVFPSLYEGFGIPPLEAMHLGCPVVSSNAASLPEVLGGAAFFVSPHDDASLLQGLCEVWQTPGLRKDMAEKGRDRAARFTWKDSATLLLEECRKVLGVPAT